MNRLFISRLASPLGELILIHDGQCLWKLYSARSGAAPSDLLEIPVPDWLEEPFAAYFGGKTDALDVIPVELEGTAFQRQVWLALRQIPAGSTWSYAKLAKEVNRPRAFRAAGTANGANPVWIVIPCHRVIASDGRLGGYSGGLDVKQWLLKHEGVRVKGES